MPSNLMKISIYFERCPLAMVSSEINAMVTYIPGCRAHDKMLVKHLSSEVFPLKSEKGSTCSTLLGVRIDLSLQNQGAWRPWRTASVSRFEEEAKTYLETGALFLPKDQCLNTTNTENTGASDMNCVCCFEARWGEPIRVLVGKM